MIPAPCPEMPHRTGEYLKEKNEPQYKGNMSGPTELPYEELASFLLPIMNSTPTARKAAEAKDQI
ncbi:hypothetical protein KEH51_14505 [[Brevibacterium] frigoritolerans]|uniref:Uncharacterized protein n=1 Tax=Peribacillus frigoritolerans TaxID=450367 RepID=A0A941FJA0_9BACI|nr:hypothetical protein [Peribacillus frigoritolerans]